ncbi:MAG: hypothetical protein BTN85_2118 [Candidatus Methanohalarchaeum thermophilum]|uniref:DUF8125 domain-containing protein n=1 Tax=Methanohalarchaeum thermophilum TaxID=1903181 RepID=A0A1Q6DT07_METT1|nr:MAG: hypothetical protein BTN85_2118 [Candidatus Methanohalarchaeum thermophilum]
MEEGKLLICRTYDPVEQTATGTWKASANDLELLRNKEKIRDLREKLEEQAKKGLKVRALLPSLVRNSVNEIASDLIKSIEEEAIYNGEKINKNTMEELK